MKIKTDHITNSSSASFILMFTCPDCNDKEDFIENVLNPLIEYYEQEEMFANGFKKMGMLSFKDIRQAGEHIFELEEWVSMYNSYDDISEFFKFLMIMHAQRLLLPDFNCNLENFKIQSHAI